MKMLISPDWLRRKIESDPDVDTGAGPSIGLMESAVPTDEDNILRVVQAFGVLVRQLRRQQQWTIEELAKRTQIDAEDLRQIERDPHYRPRFHVVHQLSTVYGVPERPLLRLSGATVTADHDFEEKAMRFAAKSDDMSQLSEQEQQALNEYVKYLVEEAT
jgi:transcriptional regulator with XRE-family HTH domain